MIAGILPARRRPSRTVPHAIEGSPKVLNFIVSLVLAYGPDILAAVVGLVLSLIMIKRRGSLYALFGFLAMLVAVGIGIVDLVYLTWFASHNPDTVLMVSRVLNGAADIVLLAAWALILVALFIKPKPEPAKPTPASGGPAQAGWPTQPAAGAALGGQPPAAAAPANPGNARPVSGQPAAQPAPGFGQPVPGQPQPGFGQPQAGAGGPAGGGTGTPQWGQPGAGPSPY
ncbi:hypothetical protein [Actinocatenispora sera]|uniref:Uncharacterized protein n=1 Tax=Actinocatenispora sera TaxID=390989 RepID=A0A810KVG8_9ACTN|nr:hypothetical protein [Actinocatenispora sera]BCJ27034.1 hypothetical protein Asera_11420 [Actinocatenispora sera]